MTNFKVLSTKKLTPTLVSEAAKKGIDIIEKEFISIQPVINETLIRRILQLFFSKDITVVFTSAQAVTVVDKILLQGANSLIPSWKIFCLSGKTRETIETSFCIFKDQIIDTAQNATDLANKIIQHGASEVVFFCGNKRRDELPGILLQTGIHVEEIVVYHTLQTPVVQTGFLDGVLFFSPSSVQSFFSVNELNKKTVCFAIGKTTAAAIGEYTDNKILTSDFPRQKSLLSTVTFYFQHRECYE